MNARLFAPDPIDFVDPTPYSSIEYQGHMILGAIWFAAALIAFFAIKGSRPHVWAGRVCIVGVVGIAATAAVMLAYDFVPPLALNAVTSVYCVFTAWLALKPSSADVRRAELALTGVEILAVVIFVSIALPNVIGGGVPIIGPGTVLLVPLLLLAGDLNFHLRQANRERVRVQRHMARMIWAFVIVLRAPLVEFETAGFYDLPDPLLVVGPVLLGLVMLAYFLLRYNPRKNEGMVAQPA